MGDPLAAGELANYYSSEGYKLPKGQVTENEADLQKAIEYEELTLTLIQSQPNYPFDDPYGDNFRNERKNYPYLKTASNLTGSYMNLYVIRSIAHIKSTNQDVGNATLEPLYQAIDAADRCLSISYNSDVWSRRVYDNKMAICREDKEFAKTLLPLEKERLQVSKTSCKNIKLSQCTAHNAVDSQIEQLYGEHLERINQMVAAL